MGEKIKMISRAKIGMLARYLLQQEAANVALVDMT